MSRMTNENPFNNVVYVDRLGVPNLEGLGFFTVKSLVTVELNHRPLSFNADGLHEPWCRTSSTWIDGVWSHDAGISDARTLGYSQGLAALMETLAANPNFGKWFLDACIVHVIEKNERWLFDHFQDPSSFTDKREQDRCLHAIEDTVKERGEWTLLKRRTVTNEQLSDVQGLSAKDNTTFDWLDLFELILG